MTDAHSPSTQHRSEWRGRAIRWVLDARFSLAALETARNSDPGSWTRNDMGRGIYAEALRESRRLEGITDAELEAELAAIALK